MSMSIGGSIYGQPDAAARSRPAPSTGWVVGDDVLAREVRVGSARICGTLSTVLCLCAKNKRIKKLLCPGRCTSVFVICISYFGDFMNREKLT